MVMPILDVCVLNDGSRIACKAHQLEKCTDCNVDWTAQNELAKSLKSIKDLPPPNVPNPIINTQVNRLKDEGNKYFKNKRPDYKEAIRLYSMAMDMSLSRPLWEPAAFQFVREELSTILSNRSAAYYMKSDYINAYIDAELVTSVKAEWSKGWFRKGKALSELGRQKEALDAFRTGLRLDPNDEDLQKGLEKLQEA